MNLPEIRDAYIFRSPQPDDVVALRITGAYTYAEAHRLGHAAEERLGCRVIVLAEQVEIVPWPERAPESPQSDETGSGGTRGAGDRRADPEAQRWAAMYAQAVEGEQ